MKRYDSEILVICETPDDDFYMEALQEHVNRQVEPLNFNDDNFQLLWLGELGVIHEWKKRHFRSEIIIYGNFTLSEEQYFTLARRCDGRPELIHVHNIEQLQKTVDMLLDKRYKELEEYITFMISQDA